MLRLKRVLCAHIFWLIFFASVNVSISQSLGEIAGWSKGTAENGVCKPSPAFTPLGFEPPLDSVDVAISFDYQQFNPLGQRTTYSISATNAGPAVATQVVLTNQIPPQMVSPAITVSQGTYSISNGLVRWEIGTLLQGAGGTLSVETTPVMAGAVPVAAGVKPFEFDWNYLNNLRAIWIPLGGSDLAVLIQQPPNDQIQAGVPFQVSVIVTNCGPDATEATLYTDTFNNFSTIGYILSQGQVLEFRRGGLPWQVNLETLPAFGIARLTLTLVPLHEGKFDMASQVSGSLSEVNLENNVMVATLSVAPGSGFLQFAAAKTNVLENCGTVSIEVFRTEGAVGTVQVDYTTHDDRAIAGQDYGATIGTLNFEAGEIAKNISIPILDNTENECNRELVLSLSSPKGGASLTGNTNITVFIVDDEAVASGSLEPVSLSTNRVEMGNGDSTLSSLSPDGRFLAFTSFASNLVAGDTNQFADVFLKDFQTDETSIVSLNRFGTGGGNSGSAAPIMTPDGRYVAFVSYATDLVTNEVPAGMPQVYIRDMVARTISLVSVLPNGRGANWGIQHIAQEQLIMGISTNGQVIAFLNDGNELGNGVDQLFVRDLIKGTTALVTATVDGAFALNFYGLQASLSRDGRYIAFTSGERNIVSNFNNIHGNNQVYVKDLLENRTCPVSMNTQTGEAGHDDSGGLEIHGSFNPRMAPDGLHIAFQSTVNSLVPDDDNPYSDIFLRDIVNGTTKRLSKGIAGPCELISSSRDGRCIAFRGGFRPGEPGPIPSDNSSQLYVYDRLSNSVILVTTACSGNRPANGHSYNPVISQNGRYLFFQSYASDLTPGQFADGCSYLFRRDLQEGETVLVSQSRDLKSAGMFPSSLPGFILENNISDDGNTAVVVSQSPDLLYEDNNAFSDLFLWHAGVSRNSDPILNVTKEQSDIILRWPIGATNWILQQTTNLQTPDWVDTPSTNAPYQLPAVGQRFFRLRNTTP